MSPGSRTATKKTKSRNNNIMSHQSGEDAEREQQRSIETLTPRGTDLSRQLVQRIVTEVDVRQTGQSVDGVWHKGDGVVLQVQALDVRLLDGGGGHGGEAVVGEVDVGRHFVQPLHASKTRDVRAGCSV